MAIGGSLVGPLYGAEKSGNASHYCIQLVILVYNNLIQDLKNSPKM